MYVLALEDEQPDGTGLGQTVGPVHRPHGVVRQVRAHVEAVARGGALAPVDGPQRRRHVGTRVRGVPDQFERTEGVQFVAPLEQ